MSKAKYYLFSIMIKYLIEFHYTVTLYFYENNLQENDGHNKNGTWNS